MFRCVTCKKDTAEKAGGTCGACAIAAGPGGLKKVGPPSRPAITPQNVVPGQSQLRPTPVVVRAGPPTLPAGTLPGGATLLLQYRQRGAAAWTDVDATTTLFILRDSAVEFKLLTVGGDVTLQPLVRLETAKWDGFGQSGGATCLVTFKSNSGSLTAPTTLRVSFGGQTATVPIVVYSLNITAVIADNFAHRSQTDLGVCEEVRLGFTTTPAGITAAQAGGLRWQFADGKTQDRRTTGLLLVRGGTAPATATGEARFLAPIATHDEDSLLPAHVEITLKLAVVAGPSRGLGPTRAYTIHQPQAHLTQEPGTQAHHWNPPGGRAEASAGFTGVFHFTPKDVSFSNIGFREGRGRLTADGVAVDREVGENHQPTSEPLPVTGGNAATGSTGDGWSDNIHSSAPTFNVLRVRGEPAGSPVTRVGGKTWPITWQYTCRDLITGDFKSMFYNMQTAYHTLTIYQNGRATMTKGHRGCTECTASVSVDLDAPHFWP